MKSKLAAAVNSILAVGGARIVAKSSIDDLMSRPSVYPALLPKGAESYLRSDNPRLEELKVRYASLAYAATDHSTWSDKLVRSIVLQFFRGDNPYVWQYRDKNTEIKYFLTSYYIQKIDSLRLLRTLQEDDLFGAYTFDFNGELTVSRDLLDSIVEIYFLERSLGIASLSDISILDIGAGYGRLAHRMIAALPNIGKYFCVDAVPESTFLSEYYLSFREVDQKATVVPLFEIENILENNAIDLAINVHSFSECTLASINWWLDILQKYKIRYLMLVPNAGSHGGTRLLSRESARAKETDNNSRNYFFDLLPHIRSRGYELIVREPKYLDTGAQKYGVSPTHHYLFELAS